MACVDICPKRAITIKDDLSAYNAVIDSEKCIGCNACYRVCQQIHPAKSALPAKWFQGWCKDPSLRERSTSGGLASSVSKAFIESGGCVCSCTFKNGRFIFDFAQDTEALNQFAGSKYVKSDPSGSYKQVKEKLKNGDKVLFIGLPCQVAALKNFVGKDLERDLYTVDLICHGTPSPKILKCFLEQYRIKLSSLHTIGFRQKIRCQISCDNKKISPSGVMDRYSMAFNNRLILTDNCFSCHYAKTERVSDLTLGDSWGSDLPEEEQKKGISLVLVQTDKGSDLLDMADLELKDVDIPKAVSRNKQLSAPPVVPDGRDIFFREIKQKKNFNKIISAILPKQCFRQNIKKILVLSGVAKIIGKN